MPAQSLGFLSFNRGLISRLALARLDIARGRLSAALMTNWMPRVLGSMMLRPGLGYTGATRFNNAARNIPFVFAINDKALLEMTAANLRIWVDDALVVRDTVASAVANDGFLSNLSSWTDNDEAGGTSVWVTGGYMGLTGNGTAAAIRDQTVTVALADRGREHALRITVQRGPVTLRVGTSTSDDSYINETELQTGTHSLAFTPTGDFNIRFLNRLKRQVLVDSCFVESAGTLVLPTPWGASDLSRLRYDQSGDVIFITAPGYTQRRIERRAATSWSVVQYLPEDGPFRIVNVSPITLTPGALSGNTTLTASAALFKSTHAPSANNAGALFRVASSGQMVTQSVTAQNVFTNAIQVTGVNAQRIFTVTVAEDGGGAATFTLQRSLDSDSGPWSDVQAWTASVTAPFDDGLDNQIAWYRLGVKTGDYGSGTHTVTLTYTVGSITGVARVTAYTSPTLVDVEVIADFGATAASDDWHEGDWSDRRGWPTAGCFHEGRLCWAGKGKFWASVSDAFDSFDDTVEGDSGPINKPIGSGPVDAINWMVSLDRLVMGGQGAEWVVRTSSLDEPITPANCKIKSASTQGSAPVGCVQIDKRAVFVQKSGTRVYDLSLAADPSATDYSGVDLTQIVPEVGAPRIVRMAVQRQPDTRVHCVLSDGTAAVLVFEAVENVLCWIKVESDGAAGLIEDVCVLPGSDVEDDVYYVVQRTVNGSTVRFLEKWAKESEAQGSTMNKQADAFITYSGPATTTIPVPHLEGRQVAVWADGADVGTATSTAAAWSMTHTVTGGQIVLPTAATNVCVGLPYRARWRAGKLALQAALGVSLTKKKRVSGLGLILADTHARGLFFGRDFTHMDCLPLVRKGAPVNPASMLVDEEDGPMVFPGDWENDARICLEARAPRPCTTVAMVADADVHEQR